MKKELKDRVVPWLYTAREYNTSVLDKAWANPDYGRMMLNENPIPPSEKVVAAMADIAKRGNRYPDSMRRLKTKLAELNGVGPENIALANGSSDIIDAMMRVFLKPGDELIISNPTFGLFPPRAELVGGKVVSIPLREDDLQYDVEAMLAAINDRTGLIVIINPNNPTGMFIDDADLEQFCETGVPLCVDEAYLEYHPDIPNKVPLIKNYPQVFISHTLSKAFGLAGIRFGYLVGTREIVEAFETMFLPWNVSLPAMAAAEAILDNPEELQAKVKHNNDWMDVFFTKCEEVGLKPFPPHGNYMLIDATMTGKTTEEILEAAEKDFRTYLKKIPPIHGKTGYFRVTPGLDDECRQFVKFLETYFG